MIDLHHSVTATELFFYTDASAAKELGYGCVFDTKWTYGQWEQGFIKDCNPSIEYLELFALCAAFLTWQQDEKLKNNRVIIFCDNMAIVNMINKTVSGCENCMYLLRILILNCMINNLRLFAKYVRSKDNGLADALSRLQFKRFRQLAKEQKRQMDEYPHTTDNRLWPLSKIWDKHN